MDNPTDSDQLIEDLLQERYELYLELSRLREIDNGAIENAEVLLKENDAKIKEQEEKIKHLIDQLCWYRRKLWKSSSEKYIPEDPNQRKIDFEGMDVLPEEEEAIAEAAREIISYERNKSGQEKKQPVVCLYRNTCDGKKKLLNQRVSMRTGCGSGKR